MPGAGAEAILTEARSLLKRVCVRFFTCFAEAFLGLPAPIGAPLILERSARRRISM